MSSILVFNWFELTDDPFILIESKPRDRDKWDRIPTIPEVIASDGSKDNTEDYNNDNESDPIKVMTNVLMNR